MNKSYLNYDDTVALIKGIDRYIASANAQIDPCKMPNYGRGYIINKRIAILAVEDGFSTLYHICYIINYDELSAHIKEHGGFASSNLDEYITTLSLLCYDFELPEKIQKEEFKNIQNALSSKWGEYESQVNQTYPLIGYTVTQLLEAFSA